MHNVTIKYPKNYLTILNQVFEIENKLNKIKEENSIQRNIDRLKDFFETEAFTEGQGLAYHNPIGESYDETRTDCDASISGTSHENLEIIEVLKPIIFVKFLHQQESNSLIDKRMIVQKGIVIVQSKNINQ